jgi:hypothetical protein
MAASEGFTNAFGGFPNTANIRHEGALKGEEGDEAVSSRAKEMRLCGW